MDTEIKKTCAKCDKTCSDWVECDECKKRVCFYCRYDGYVADVWVLSFCYDCQPHLKKEKKFKTK